MRREFRLALTLATFLSPFLSGAAPSENTTTEKSLPPPTVTAPGEAAPVSPEQGTLPFPPPVVDSAQVPAGTPAIQPQAITLPVPDMATETRPPEMPVNGAVTAAPVTGVTAEHTEPDSAPSNQTPSPALAVPANQVVTSSITVAQMGQPEGIILRGGQLESGINFTIPNDVVITDAQLKLNIYVSPAMASRHSTLQLMMNGQPLGTVPLGSAESDDASYQIDLPGEMVVSGNNLSFHINDDDVLLCQRELTDKYEVIIRPDSRLELEGLQLNIGSDLSHFPRPFFDSMRLTPARLAFAFPAQVTPEQVSAAALVSSWLGFQADYRGISFDALTNTLPEKHGILIGAPGQKIGEVTLPQASGPLLQIIDNPANPVYKLLLIVGKDDTQLRNAAWRLTHGEFKQQTASFDVKAVTIPVSEPYDAPRWINTQRPVRLSELLRPDQSMTATGRWHDALRVGFRAAPDLFLWDGKTIPLHINYRFPSENWIDEDKSYLNVIFNNTFLRNLPVNKPGLLQRLWHKIGGDARQENAALPLEPYLIYGDNQLSLYFNIVPTADAPCNVLSNNNIQSRIEENSWIDLSHARHFTMLPNLSYFVGASFPFSRLADYSQTALVLPERPTSAEIATLLNLAARSGNATGTALNHNQVLFGLPAGGANLLYLTQRDILAVSSLEQSDFNRRFLADSPFISDNQSFGVRTPSVAQKIGRWLSGEWALTALDADRYFSSNEAWRGFISFQSPWNDSRTVVLATGTNDEQLLHLHRDLSSAKINAAIRGDAAIITDENGVRSFRVSPQFPSGQMPWYMMVVWYANQHAAMLAILAFIICVVTGASLYTLLKRRARKRLNPESGS